MTEMSPGSARVPEDDIAGPDPGGAPQAPRRTTWWIRSPLARAVAAAIGAAVIWGAFHAAENLWAGRHDNTPVASSSRAPSGRLTVSGHGITLAFPAGWINVPTTPKEYAKFLRAAAARFPHLKASLKNQLGSLQAVRNLAMVVVRVSPGGIITGDVDVVVAPDAIAPRQLLPHLKGLIAQLGGTDQRDSLTTFGNFPAALITYQLPGHAGRPVQYGAQAYVRGPASTAIITLYALKAADAAATLRQITDTIKFS